MQKDSYIVLGLEKGATREDVESAYRSLKERYSNDRFLEGEEGANAARRLSEIEVAYHDCLEDIRMEEEKNNTGNAYSSIETAIKEGHYDDAQRQLDDIDVRDAEWHYYQSMIYFKKGWHSESKNQLELCIALEPHNEKYNKALDKMNNFLNNQGAFKGEKGNSANANSGQQAQPQYEQRAGYSDKRSNADANANACCDTCCTMMCMDSCCECMGGDLIPCC